MRFALMYLASVDTDIAFQLSVALADDAPVDVVVTVTAPSDALNYREEGVVRIGEVRCIRLCVVHVPLKCHVIIFVFSGLKISDSLFVFKWLRVHLVSNVHTPCDQRSHTL